MATPTVSTLFVRLVNVWRHLSLRSDVDNVLLELLGQFSLEKIYSDGDKGTYQHLITTLLCQLNAIFYLQRLSMPAEGVQIGPFLGILASWEVTLRSVELVLQTVAEGREILWDAHLLRDKYLAEFLLSALRFLTLHPKAPINQPAIDRRERFARIHRLLERVYDSYPNPKSFLLLVCKDITDCLRTEPDALSLPPKLRYELPNLTAELYPLADCLTSKSVSTIVSRDGQSGGWLPQFLALRDVSQFVVGASVQCAVNRGVRDLSLQSSSVATRNAVLKSLDNLRIPPHLAKVEVVASFSETFRIILPDTPTPELRNSAKSQAEENETNAISALCARLTSRQIIHRVSDGEMMHNISEITANIALLDDPSGQYRSSQPRLYAMNCQRCHLVGYSQIRYLGNLKFESGPGGASEIRLPPQSKCIYCADVVTMLREIPLARHAWELLKPIQSNATDTVNSERHLPTRFQLAAPKFDLAAFASSTGCETLPGPTAGERSPSMEPPYAQQRKPSYSNSNSGPARGTDSTQYPNSPQAVSSRQPARLMQSEHSPAQGSTSIDGTYQSLTQKTAEFRRMRDNVGEPPVSPDLVSPVSPDAPRANSSTTLTSVRPAQSVRTPSSSTGGSGKAGFLRFNKPRKESSTDTTSLSSTSDSQKTEEIQLDGLKSMLKTSVKGKSSKVVNVYLSQNSTHALFWSRPAIHIWDVGTTPPTAERMIQTDSTCVLAAVTKTYLAYIIGARGQRLTLRIINHSQASVSPIEYSMQSSPWCRSIAICPLETYVVVGFENSVVRFFKTAHSEEPREDQLHNISHRDGRESPSVDTLSFSNDGLALLASTRSTKTGVIHVYIWRFPFESFQELPKCRYRVPLHESEDNGVSSATFRPAPGIAEELVCITTWTQSGDPILVQPEDGHTSVIKADISNSPKKLGSRIQCAAFSPSGKLLATVNDKGHLYQISNLNSDPMEVRRIATSRELTAKSESFDMTFMIISDEASIVIAWVDSNKARGFIKKIPITSNEEVNFAISHNVGTPEKAENVHVPPQSGLPGDNKPRPELPGDPTRSAERTAYVRQLLRHPVELSASEEHIALNRI